MLKTDLHLHAKEDEMWIKHSAKELINRASELNFDVLSLTFHDELFYPADVVRYADDRDILLIPGSELTLEGKHVLVYGLNDTSGIKTFDDLRKLRERKNCLVIAAHPFFKKKICLGNKLIKHIDVFDGVEFCHFYNHLFNFNKKAEIVARKHNKTLVGNSDCHIIPLQLDRTYSIVDADKNMESVFESVRNNKVNVVSRPLPMADVFRLSLGMKLFRKF